MSAQISPDDDDDYVDGAEQPQKPNGGGTVSTEDVLALLEQEREKNRRLEADNNRERSERNRVEAQVSTHRDARFDAEEQAVSARIAAADSEAAGLRRDYAAAMAEGKFDEVAEINDKIAELRAKQNEDRRYKTWLEGEKTRITSAPPQPPGIDLAQYTPGQRAWIRKHPEFMEDEQLRTRTFAAHQLAVADGHEIDSPEYFQVIDEVALRGRKTAQTSRVREESQDDGSGHEGTPPPPAPRRERAPEVPVSRSQPGEGRRQDRPVQLTPNEREMADATLYDYPVQPEIGKDGRQTPSRYQVYARRRDELKAQGKM